MCFLTWTRGRLPVCPSPSPPTPTAAPTPEPALGRAAGAQLETRRPAEPPAGWVRPEELGLLGGSGGHSGGVGEWQAKDRSQEQRYSGESPQSRQSPKAKGEF